MVYERALVIILYSSWYLQAEAASGEGECTSGFRPVVTPSFYIDQGKQVIIPSLKFNDSGHITAFHLAGTCGGGELGVGPGNYTNTTQECINILQVWRPSSVGNRFSIAANFTATLAVIYNAPVTASVTVDTPVPFSSGDVLGFTPGPDNPGFVFQIAHDTLNQQPASHMYYTYGSFVTELMTAGSNRVTSSPIISVEVECSPSATMEPPELPSSTELISSVQQTGSPSVSSPSVLPDASTSQPASESTSSSPEVVTSVATTTSVTSGGQEESGASAGVAAGVAVGLVLAVVVVVVVVAIVLAAVCSVRRRRKKYDPTCSVTYEVPPDVYVAISNPESEQYEMIPLSNGNVSPDEVYDVPCEVDKMEHTSVPPGCEVPRSSTLLSSSEAVTHASAEENGVRQGEIYYNMGCHDDGELCNSTATPTYGNMAEHEYQEADFMSSKSPNPLLEESVEQEPFPIYGFVPTVSERSQLPDDEDTEYQLLQECQATETAYNSGHLLQQTGDTCNGNGGNVVDGVYETSSTDEDIYWSPSIKEEEIYAQMSRRKYQEIPRDKVKMLTKLGEGEFGEVYKAVLKTPTGPSQDVAVKVVKKGAPRGEERLKLLQEAAILGQFRHRHVVSLFGVVTLGEPKMMVMELLPGDLKSHLGQISETDSLRSDPDLPSLLIQFCQQVVDGLVCLAGKSFVHRDIAARNILLDKELNCKISDFGMTREVESEMYYKLGKDTKIPVKWTAPEAILFKTYTTKSDIWSYGMLMYEIWSLGHKPFESNTVQEMVRLLDAHYCLPPPPGCPREVYSVMVDCWNPAHNERPTAADILGTFCKSERVLLAWRSENPVSPLSRTLGAPLSEGETLHRDLQNKYKDSLVKQ